MKKYHCQKIFDAALGDGYDSIYLIKEGFDVTSNDVDAVLCLGNSLTCLFGRKNQIGALKQLHSILKKAGVLIIDERNYQYILDNKKEILKGSFKYSGKYLYCGKDVYSKPIEITKNRVRFEVFDERNKKKAYFVVYPFKRGKLKQLLEKLDFQKIEQYSDYQPGYNPEVDFYFYVCQK